MRNRNIPLWWAALASILLLGAVSCQSPNSPVSISKTGASSLSVSIVNPSARTVVASGDDMMNSITSLAISVVGTTVVSGTVAYITGVTKTFTSLSAGSYTVEVNAYNGATLEATGSSSVTVVADSTVTATVPLTFSPSQSGTGGFSLAISWPTMTPNLGYVSAVVDTGTPFTAPVTTGSSNTATLAMSGLSSGVHTLAITFKASSGATVSVGPFLESINIWDGVTSTTWVDSSGNNQTSRQFSASEFAANNTTLSGLTIGGTPALSASFSSSTTTYSLTGGIGIGNTFTFTALPTLGSQNVTFTWNGVTQNWSSTTTSSLTSGTLTMVQGINTVVLTVTAPDRQTTQTYTVSTPCISTAASFVNDIASNMAGNFVLNENITTAITAPIGGATPFTGTLVGNGYNVNLAIPVGNPSSGLFEEIGLNGVVSDLTLTGTVTGTTDVGSVAGINSGGTVTGCTASTIVIGTSDVGGIVGHNKGPLLDCIANGSVSGTQYVGGITGINTGPLSLCYSSLNWNDATSVVSSTNGYVGGIAGQSSGSLDHCFTDGSVNGGTGSFVGGLVGELDSTATECYSVASVTTSASSGSYAGGLVGHLSVSGTVSSCYARGAVTAYSYVGGLIGYNDGSILESYASGIVTGSASGGLVGSTSTTIPDSWDSTAGDYYDLLALTTEVPSGWPTGPAYDQGWAWASTINPPYPYLNFFQVHGIGIDNP